MEPSAPEPAGQTYDSHTVADVMRQAATTVETGGHLAAAAYLMTHANQSALVVVDQADRAVAMITEADLLRAVARGADTGEERIADWMNRNPTAVNPDTMVIEAAEIMAQTGTRHLPVVSDGRVVGIVAISDIMDAVVRSTRFTGVVVQVADLARSLAFYHQLLRYPITARDSDIALLAGRDGSQLILRQVGEHSKRQSDALGVHWVGWTAGGTDDLDRCSDVLKQHGAFLGRETTDGITILRGRDPDGLSIVIVYPGPERVPRRLMHTLLLSRERSGGFDATSDLLRTGSPLRIQRATTTATGDLTLAIFERAFKDRYPSVRVETLV